jgi:hypothetical protein
MPDSSLRLSDISKHYGEVCTVEALTLDLAEK